MSPTPTKLGFALLGLLHQMPQSGYDLRKIFATTALGSYSSSPGAIYPALARLERAGLVESRVDRTRCLRPRVVYRPTPAGTAALRGWLTAEVTSSDVERNIDELLLRFAFLGLLEEREHTRQLLRGLAEHADALARNLKRQRTRFPPGTPIHPRLALEAGLAHYLASAKWARKALGHFEESPSNARRPR